MINLANKMIPERGKNKKIESLMIFLNNSTNKVQKINKT